MVGDLDGDYEKSKLRKHHKIMFQNIFTNLLKPAYKKINE